MYNQFTISHVCFSVMKLDVSGNGASNQLKKLNSMLWIRQTKSAWRSVSSMKKLVCFYCCNIVLYQWLLQITNIKSCVESLLRVWQYLERFWCCLQCKTLLLAHYLENFVFVRLWSLHYRSHISRGVCSWICRHIVVNSWGGSKGRSNVHLLFSDWQSGI